MYKFSFKTGLTLDLSEFACVNEWMFVISSLLSAAKLNPWPLQETSRGQELNINTLVKEPSEFVLGYNSSPVDVFLPCFCLKK